MGPLATAWADAHRAALTPCPVRPHPGGPPASGLVST